MSICIHALPDQGYSQVWMYIYTRKSHKLVFFTFLAQIVETTFTAYPMLVLDSLFPETKSYIKYNIVSPYGIVSLWDLKQAYRKRQIWYFFSIVINAICNFSQCIQYSVKKYSTEENAKRSQNNKPFYGMSHIWELMFRSGAAPLTLKKAVVCVIKNKKTHEHIRTLLIFLIPHTIWNLKLTMRVLGE